MSTSKANRSKRLPASGDPLVPAEVLVSPVDGRRRRGLATRAAILHEGVQLASTDGLGGLTMHALADRLGVPKSSVHAAFGSKEELQIEVLRHTRAILISHVVTPALAAPPGHDRLVAIGAAWFKYLSTGVFEGGCVLAASSSEVDGRPGPARDELVAVMSEWLRFLADNVSVAVKNKQYVVGTSPEQLAFELNAIGLAANWHHQLFGGRGSFAFARRSWAKTLAQYQPRQGHVSVTDT
jgi:AcrR family transcriptional regulator